MLMIMREDCVMVFYEVRVNGFQDLLVVWFELCCLVSIFCIVFIGSVVVWFVVMLVGQLIFVVYVVMFQCGCCVWGVEWMVVLIGQIGFDLELMLVLLDDCWVQSVKGRIWCWISIVLLVWFWWICLMSMLMVFCVMLVIGWWIVVSLGQIVVVMGVLLKLQIVRFFGR